MDSDDDFEPPPERRRRVVLQDVSVVQCSAVPEVSQAVAPRETQVFYFSQKMFDYMCENGTAERIQQEASRLATQRKGDIVRRQQAATRTANLREFVQDKGFEKPSGPEISELRRRQHHTKKNTDQIMGRSVDSLKRRRYNADHSDASHTEELSQLSQQPSASECVSSQNPKPKKRTRNLWAKFPVPPFNSGQSSQCAVIPPSPCDDDAEKNDERSAVAALAKQLAIDFKGEDDIAPINEEFRLQQSTYNQGHFLTSCIAFCTLKKTGQVFIRASVDNQKQAVVMKCKLSSDLTGRATQRKRLKQDDYGLQAAAMLEGLENRDNVLWQGKHRTSFTKRVCNCKCALRLRYVETAKEWRATITCEYHTGHADKILPPPLLVPTKVIDILQSLRSNINATVAQQLQLCAQNGLPVTADFIRRINASASADPSFGLSGDAGFLFALIGSPEKLSFAAEFELVDDSKKVHQRVTVGRVAGKYTHIKGGKMSQEPSMNYAGLDSRTSDAQLHDFYAFLLPLLIRQNGLKVTLRNCTWCTDEDLKLLAAHPNVVMFDTTCKTNVKNKHFGWGSGRTMNHNWFKGWSFFLESLQKRDFWWLWNTALPALIPEAVRKRLLVVVTDGDSNMIDAITGATSAVNSNGQLVWGMEERGGVRMRRCVFHLLNLNFESEYKAHNQDGDVGKKVRDWLKQAGQKAETKDDLMDAVQKILQWIQIHEHPLFTEAARAQLIEWVTARSMHTEEWARYNFNHLTCFDIETTSPAEGAHSGLKMDNQVSIVL